MDDDTTAGEYIGSEKPVPVHSRRSTSLSAEEAQERRIACQTISRRARDAFEQACGSNDGGQAETSFMASKADIDELWAYTSLRGRGFQDLLGALDAATRGRDLCEFKNDQRRVMADAFADLPKWFLDDSDVERHLNAFAEHDIDLARPLRGNGTAAVPVPIKQSE